MKKVTKSVFRHQKTIETLKKIKNRILTTIK